MFGEPGASGEAPPLVVVPVGTAGQHLAPCAASTAAAIRVVTCGGGGGVLDRQDAAACRSCGCEDDKTEGGCWRQDRCPAGPAEARRAGPAAAGVPRPGGTRAAR